MKELFRGYYKLTTGDIKSIWESGFISVDTNALLNIYRYSQETRADLLKLLDDYSSQLWLPYHVAYEFHKNRISVIDNCIDDNDSAIKELQKINDTITQNPRPPHLSKKNSAKFIKTIKESIRDLERKKDFYKKLLTNDTILNKITAIFDGKVGAGLSKDEMKALEKEGEERYKNKVPPGYKDSAKSENKYGDLIIWKEIIEKSKRDQKPFIFIIDDQKEDWWLKVKGVTISPRPELLQEVYTECKVLLHLYTPHSFLQFAAQTKEIKPETITEVKDIIPEFKPYDLYAKSFDFYTTKYNFDMDEYTTGRLKDEKLQNGFFKPYFNDWLSDMEKKLTKTAAALNSYRDTRTSFPTDVFLANQKEAEKTANNDSSLKDSDKPISD